MRFVNRRNTLSYAPTRRMADLADHIQRHRARLRLSQAELAKRVGVRQATVSDWESRKAIPTPANVAAMAEAFGISAEELRGGGTVRVAAPAAEYRARPPELPRQLELLALEFEREMVSADVDAGFKRYARARLRDPELLELYSGGYVEGPMTADEQLADYESLIRELRARLKRRLALLKKRGRG